MFQQGHLIYFSPFYFKDASPAKPKYFIVLKIVEEMAILASLPSSQRHLPDFVTTLHGCVNLPEVCIGCYIFEANRPITTSGWSFPLPTFLYGEYLDIYEIALLDENYPVQGIDFEIIGTLTDTECVAILNCFSVSPVVKRKFKRMLCL